MALEDRVRVLEDEIAILKDEIRNALLEIHEQILIHYYPDLRAQETSAPNTSLVATRGSGTPRQTASFSGIQRVALNETEPESLADSAVHWSELGDTVRPPVKGTVVARPADSDLAPSDGSLDEIETSAQRATILRLAEWASESVTRIGKERTVKVLEVYAQSGRLSPATRDTLLQFIAISDDEAQPQRVSMRAILDVLARLNEALGCTLPNMATSQLAEELRVG